MYLFTGTKLWEEYEVVLTRQTFGELLVQKTLTQLPPRSDQLLISYIETEQVHAKLLSILA